MIKLCVYIYTSYISDVHSLVPSFRWGLVSVTFSLSKSSIRNCCFHRRHHNIYIYKYYIKIKIRARIKYIIKYSTVLLKIFK